MTRHAIVPRPCFSYAEACYSPSDNSAELIKTEQNPIFQTPTTLQDLSTLSKTFQNLLVYTGLTSPELAQILLPVKNEKSKITRII